MAWTISSGPTDFLVTVPTTTGATGPVNAPTGSVSSQGYSVRGWSYVLTSGATTATTYVVVNDWSPRPDLLDKGLALVTGHLADPLPPGQIIIEGVHVRTLPQTAIDPLHP